MRRLGDEEMTDPPEPFDVYPRKVMQNPEGQGPPRGVVVKCDYPRGDTFFDKADDFFIDTDGDLRVTDSDENTVWFFHKDSYESVGFIDCMPTGTLPSRFEAIPKPSRSQQDEEGTAG